jgi:hypothetical protein
MRRFAWACVVAGVLLAGCASGGMNPEESALRALLWDAATGCARNSSTITITDVDSFGRVHYSLWQGGKQDVPAWEQCYQAKTHESLKERPDLQTYYREKMAPRQ